MFDYNRYIAVSMCANDPVGKPHAVVALNQSFDWPWQAQDAVVRAFDEGIVLPVVSCPVRQH